MYPTPVSACPNLRKKGDERLYRAQSTTLKNSLEYHQWGRDRVAAMPDPTSEGSTSTNPVCSFISEPLADLGITVRLALSSS